MKESRLYKARPEFPEIDCVEEDVFVVVVGSLTELVDVTAVSPFSLALTASAPDSASAEMELAIVPACSGDAAYTTYSTSSAEVDNKLRLRLICRAVTESMRT